MLENVNHLTDPLVESVKKRPSESDDVHHVQKITNTFTPHEFEKSCCPISSNSSQNDLAQHLVQVSNNFEKKKKHLTIAKVFAQRPHFVLQTFGLLQIRPARSRHLHRCWDVRSPETWRDMVRCQGSQRKGAMKNFLG